MTSRSSARAQVECCRGLVHKANLIKFNIEMMKGRASKDSKKAISLFRAVCLYEAEENLPEHKQNYSALCSPSSTAQLLKSALR